jgi:hypothetical protein
VWTREELQTAQGEMTKLHLLKRIGNDQINTLNIPHTQTKHSHSLFFCVLSDDSLSLIYLRTAYLHLGIAALCLIGLFFQILLISKSFASTTTSTQQQQQEQQQQKTKTN